MGLRTLIVDDHEILGAGLACMLTELGHEVLDIVGTGEEAIESASRHKPDLIIMDVNLEGDMDGIAAATAIRQQLGIRSIFFSGYSDEGALPPRIRSISWIRRLPRKSWHVSSARPRRTSVDQPVRPVDNHDRTSSIGPVSSSRRSPDPPAHLSSSVGELDRRRARPSTSRSRRRHKGRR
jgi:CheY-like chemotaxis protein